MTFCTWNVPSNFDSFLTVRKYVLFLLKSAGTGIATYPVFLMNTESIWSKPERSKTF